MNKLKETYEIIDAFINERDIAPTIAEISLRASYSSPATALSYVEELERLGYISRMRNEVGQVYARSITIIKEW